MISYTKRNVNTITFILSIIIFIFINLFFQPKQNAMQDIQYDNQESQKIIEQENETKKENIDSENIILNPEESQEKIKDKKVTTKTKSSKWSIEIPAIELKAKIAEGTQKEVMDKYVGHFEETSRFKGNIGLAAHNRGYKVNYFANLKKLKKGDEIQYKYNGKEKIYLVDKIEVIRDTDWSYLDTTQENKITLITCGEDQPLYRRCIQGIEKKEEFNE